MGGKSSSKSSQTTQQSNEENYLNVVDYGDGEAPKSTTATVATGNTGTITVSSTDQGAVAAGRDIALAGLDFGRGVLAEASAQTKQTIDGALAANRGATEEIMGQFMTTVSIVALGAGALFLLARK